MSPRVFTLALFAFLLAGCDAVGGGSEDAVLTGSVVNALTNRPIVGATIQVLSMGLEETSDSSGTYVASVPVDSLQQVRLVAFKTGYAADTVTVLVEPGQAVTVPAMELALGAGGDGTSGPAASITLAPRSSQSVGVTGTGSTETAQLVFVAKDADNNPVDATHAVDIAVSIIQGPGGGEFLSPAAPETVRTDEDGEAVVTLTSGTTAGVVQVETQATVGGRTIRSQPITLVIHGGFPDQEHFGVAPLKRNFPGLVIQGITNQIAATVGDRYGNPVQPGTQVYFTTTGGLIGGSSETDISGEAVVDLMAATPFPNVTGFATVTARTAGANGVPLSASTRVLFSGLPVLRLLTPGMDLGEYTYTVSDPLGNPLAEGTTITVTVEGTAIVTSGRTSVTLSDQTSSGPGLTEFTFRVRPAPNTEETPEITSISIAVTGPNGGVEGFRPGGLRPGAAITGRARS